MMFENIDVEQVSEIAKSHCYKISDQISELGNDDYVFQINCAILCSALISSAFIDSLSQRTDVDIDEIINHFVNLIKESINSIRIND